MNGNIVKLLLFAYLFSFTPLKEFVRLPVFFVHYYEHLGSDSKLTISDFIDMHYFHGIIMDEDYERDMQLPFKDAQNLINSSVFTFTDVSHFTMPEINTPFDIHHKINVHFQDYIQKSADLSIFHPPKV
jgi:hypothetical protein